MSERFYEEYGSEEPKQNSEGSQNYYGNPYGHQEGPKYDQNGYNNYNQNQNNYNQGNGQGGYNNYGGRPQPPKREPLAVASLVLGVVGLILALLSCCCSPYFGIIVAIVNMAGIVTGILSRKGKRMEGVAIAGIIMSIFGLLIALFFVAIYAFIINTPEFMTEMEAIYESMGIDLDELNNQL